MLTLANLSEAISVVEKIDVAYPASAHSEVSLKPFLLTRESFVLGSKRLCSLVYVMRKPSSIKHLGHMKKRNAITQSDAPG
jgi:hypothetical protein